MGQVSRNAYQLKITSSCNGCSEEPLAPIVVHPEVVSFAEALGHLGAECTHNPRVPSLVVPCAGPAGSKVYVRVCSAALDGLGEDACGTVAAIRSSSFKVAHRSSVLGCSSKGEQARGLVHWESGGWGRGSTIVRR